MPKEPDRSQRKVLGKGLSALLPTRQPEAAVAPAPLAETPARYGRLQSIPLHQIRPNQDQPRTSFDGERLEELAQSLRANGLLQPISVFSTGPDQYRIIAGERRWRAAALAGFEEIPALVRTVEEQERLELALVENIQRENLNAIEIARAFQALAEHHGLQHEQIAERTGKERSTITNFLRLLRLPETVQNELINGRISAGHARCLLNLPERRQQEDLCRLIVDEQLSVRAVERMVKEINSPPAKASAPPQPSAKAPEEDANVKAALDEMAMNLGTKVHLYRKGANSGRLEIEYYSQEDLDRIYSVITKQ